MRRFPQPSRCIDTRPIFRCGRLLLEASGVGLFVVAATVLAGCGPAQAHPAAWLAAERLPLAALAGVAIGCGAVGLAVLLLGLAIEVRGL